MRIFTDPARRTLQRIITALSTHLADVAETDFLEDDTVIWSECWTQLEIAEKTEDQMVQVRSKHGAPISLVGERLLAAFHTFSNTEPIFADEARKYAAMLPCENDPVMRFKTNETGRTLLCRHQKKDAGYPSNDRELWYWIVRAVISAVHYGDDGGFWFRLCFQYAEAKGTMPPWVVHDFEDEEEEGEGE